MNNSLGQLIELVKIIGRLSIVIAGVCLLMWIAFWIVGGGIKIFFNMLGALIN